MKKLSSQMVGAGDLECILNTWKKKKIKTYSVNKKISNNDQQNMLAKQIMAWFNSETKPVARNFYNRMEIEGKKNRERAPITLQYNV